jgi:ABC-type nitrate/sulfonate/bicarbonate transport system substrate-binding protein
MSVHPWRAQSCAWLPALRSCSFCWRPSPPVPLPVPPAGAETNSVRITQPAGLLYLPGYVTADRQMIEERAEAAGLGTVKVTLTRIASGATASDRLLAGEVDISMGGWPWAGSARR